MSQGTVMISHVSTPSLVHMLYSRYSNIPLCGLYRGISVYIVIVLGAGRKSSLSESLCGLM